VINARQGFICVGGDSRGTWNISGKSTVADFGLGNTNQAGGRFGILNGDGTINVTGGATLSGRLFEVGRFSTQSDEINLRDGHFVVNVSGAGSRILAHQLRQRSPGAATITVSDSGVLDLSALVDGGAGFLLLGQSNISGLDQIPVPGTSVLNITGPGSRVSAVQAQLGAELGAATINISGGGTYVGKPSPVGATFLGVADVMDPGGTDNSSGFGAIHIDGPGSTYDQRTPSGGRIVAGGGGRSTQGGDALITVTNGGALLADHLIVAQEEGSEAVYSQSGATSSTTITASVIVGGAPAEGTINLSGGTFNAGSMNVHGRVIYSAGTLGSAGTLNVASGTVLLSSALRLPDGTPTNKKMLDIGGVTVSLNGVIDLNDNDLLVRGGQARAQVEQLITSARNFGDWNGSGITSSAAKENPTGSTTLGVLDGSDYIPIHGNLFNGRTVDHNDRLVKYTFYGDTDFNGMIDGDDYARLDNGFNFALAGWFNGDADLNGLIDADDYALIDNAFNTQSGTLRRAVDFLSGDNRSVDGVHGPSLEMVIEHFDRFGVSYAQAFLAFVPEPSTVALVGLTMLAYRRPRRRRYRTSRFSC
jgi:hypothetical protein